MKTFVVVLLATVFAFGDDGDFAKHRAEMLSHIDEKIQKMSEHKTCVTGAADKDALRKCHDAMKEWRKAEHHKRRGNHKGKMHKQTDSPTPAAGK